MKIPANTDMFSGFEAGMSILRFPDNRDCDEFISRARKSAGFHDGLVSPPRDPGSFSEYSGSCSTDTDRHILVVERSTGDIAGAMNISQVFLKGFCSAYLGYYLFEGFTGRGLMTDALSGLLQYAFEDVGLHRLEANIQPVNKSSIKLVKRCGFTKEGFSRKYLKIAGEWRDHERWAIIREDWENQ